MKHLLILAILVVCQFEARSQEIIFKDDFSDTTLWELSVSGNGSEYGTAIARFDNQKLILSANQGFTTCPTAIATLKAKVNPISPDDNIIVKVYIDSFAISGDYEFVTNLELKSTIIHLKIDQINLPKIKKPVIQFDISDSVAIRIISSLNPDSSYTYENGILNNPAHKQIIKTENSDSIEIQFQSNACAPDEGAFTKAVIDSIVITEVILNSGSSLISDKNIPVIKKYNGTYFIEFKEFTSCGINITDITGRTILSRKFDGELFDLGFLTEGIYLVNLVSEKGKFAIKIIIP
jgi:hypothetical protein